MKKENNEIVKNKINKSELDKINCNNIEKYFEYPKFLGKYENNNIYVYKGPFWFLLKNK